uniref:FAD-binding domain-containing protein n=1 Tax=Corethron hystrix TaxID=216773 RepID=A0A6U5H2C5_9STRA|mmetsp:Transcript_28826/g.65967  ORF Transcript_28826/g.65967 Transcript_28826/m.65967 type:complete len:629 (+) Transcript_28826:101-1987(+)|eukprot:CAMPEP_0113308530 /NCGR_PEP_ID=MMETSP0010_2-20120614/6940_1 /TAXON_ID=216773 ORGANISM="Corethron hystrix, Strain 308" /NCGR_SAMPLE_ID=MMETSP0010_2 /ASSEMBLY_ACC=CAM_ASM_000155 /LENGTH=628 /DNA_ID=CAMNT_0000163607 /DNA_START=101 /DNA_END=1987 /DNA_ORIENTATION=- /assembly_acc=CAM_ASM_000155
MPFLGGYATAYIVALASTALQTETAALSPPRRLTTSPRRSTQEIFPLNMVTGQQATSFGPADLLRKAKASLPQIPFLAEGAGNPANKIDMPDYVAEVLSRPGVPRRETESEERTHRIRSRAKQAAADAAALRGMLVGEEDAAAWWRSRRDVPEGGRRVTSDDPLTVLVAGGGLAGLVVAAACHSKGMRVAIFEQASSYAPYGGPIQIQSNALRAIQRINPEVFEELVAAGTFTADRVSGLKIGYRKGNKLAGLYDAGDWLVRFDTIGPALEAGLPATVVVDRPVIQQILVKHGFPDGTVRISSRIENFENLGRGKGVCATLEDGTKAYADVLVGADGVWSQVRKNLHGLSDGAGGFAASGAAGGAINDAEARKLARDTVRIAQKADRRYSGFTCYAALANHRASNIEDVSYQILLGEKKYFVSTDGGGERQQWFALIREEAGGVDPEPTEEDPHPKLTRLQKEFAATSGGDDDGNEWDPFALELINAADEEDIKRRDLYDGAPLLATLDPQRLLSPWAKGPVVLVGDAAHPMMPNLGQGGCQATEDGYRLVEELASVAHTGSVSNALGKYSRTRVIRTAIVQGFAQLGSDLLVDFDLMMTIPFLGPFFLTMTQLSMPWILRFLYTPEF